MSTQNQQILPPSRTLTKKTLGMLFGKPNITPPQGFGNVTPPEPVILNPIKAVFPPLANPNYKFYKFYQINKDQILQPNMDFLWKIKDTVGPNVFLESSGFDIRVFDSTGVPVLLYDVISVDVLTGEFEINIIHISSFNLLDIIQIVIGNPTATDNSGTIATAPQYMIDSSPLLTKDIVPLLADHSNWFDGAWQSRIPITINPSQVPSPQSNFPLLINQTSIELIGKSINELRFAGLDRIQLDYEIQKFNNLTGELIAWVKKPTISDGDITYIYFDNPTAIDEQNPNAVWSDYQYVAHMNNDEIGPPNISTALYTGNFLSITVEDTEPRSIHLSPDGLNLFMVGAQTDTIYRYFLPTPFDITTAFYTGTSLSVLSEDNSPAGIYFSPDGLNLFMVGTQTDAIYQYILTTPFDITTTSYTGNSLSILSEDSSPTSLFFSPDGLNLFMVGFTTDAIYQYILTTPFDITTTSYTGNSFSVVSEAISPRSIHFSPDGLTLFLVGSSTDKIFQYSLTTPFDITTISYTGNSLFVDNEDTSPRSIHLSPDGLNLFMVGSLSDRIYQYDNSINTVIGPVLDSTINPRDGTIKNGVQSADGKIGKALDFDGVNDYIDLGTVPINDKLQMNDSDISISFIVKPGFSGSEGFQRIISKGVFGGSEHWGITIGNTAPAGFLLIINSVESLRSLSAAIPDGSKFYHVVITKKHNDIDGHIYVDTVDKFLSSSPSTILNVEGVLDIGKISTSDFRRYENLMEEITVSKIIPTEDRVITEFNSKMNPDLFYTISPKEELKIFVENK